MGYMNLMISGAVMAGILLFSPRVAPCAMLYTDDGGFSVDIPGNWVQDESDNKSIVMLATSGEKMIRVTKIKGSGELSMEDINSGLNLIREMYLQDGIETSRVYSFRQTDGSKLYFRQFEANGKRGQVSYFNFAGRPYSMLTRGLADAEFQAIPKTISQQRAAPSPGTVAQAGIPGRGEETGADSALLPPPAGIGDGQGEQLGAPPSEAAYGGEEPVSSPEEMPALPKRRAGGALSLFLALVLISAAVLGYRAVVKREIAAPEAPPPPGAVLPFRAEKDYRAFPLAFNITDASGQQYRAVSPRIQFLVLGSGIMLYFMLKVLVQGMLFAGIELRALPTALILGLSGLITLSNLLIFIGALLVMFFRKKLKLYDPSGGLLLDICQKRATFASLYFFIRDDEGNDVAGLRRKGFAIIRRHWELLDPEGNVLADIREDSATKAIARKFLGHLWGLLRTDYVISAGDREIGAIKREWSVWNRYRLHLEPPENLDPRLALAAAVMVDVVDPDRWYPWYG